MADESGCTPARRCGRCLKLIVSAVCPDGRRLCPDCLAVEAACVTGTPVAEARAAIANAEIEGTDV